MKYYSERVRSAIIDVMGFGAMWCAALMAAIWFLGIRYPDNPWGNLAFAIIAGFCGAILLQAAIESGTTSAGRFFTGLRLEDVRCGGQLSRGRRAFRAVLKVGAIFGAVYLGLGLDATLDLPFVVALPIAGLLVANIMVIVNRADHRSLLDIAARSQSVRAR